MSFHLIVPRIRDHAWLEWTADVLLWLGILWLAVVAVVVALMLLAGGEKWQVLFSTVIPIIAISAVALALGYVICKIAKRSD